MGLSIQRAPLTTPYSERFANATRLETIQGIDGSGGSDCSAALTNLSAGYYVGDVGRVYRIDDQWTAKNGVHVWMRGSTVDIRYPGVNGSSAAINGSDIEDFGIYGARLTHPAPDDHQGRVIGVTGNRLRYCDLELLNFDSGGILIDGNDIYCDNIYLDSGKETTGNFGIRSVSGRRQKFLNIEGYTGDDMLVLSTGPNVDEDIATVVMRGIRGRSYAARIVAVDLIDQDDEGGMAADIRDVSISDVLGTSFVNGLTIRNLDSSGVLDGVSLTDIDITLSDPGEAGMLSTRPLSIIRAIGMGDVSDITTANVIFRNTINQNVQPSGSVTNVDVSGVTCV